MATGYYPLWDVFSAAEREAIALALRLLRMHLEVEEHAECPEDAFADGRYYGAARSGLTALHEAFGVPEERYNRRH